MSIPAPQARLVDALSGAKAPDKFMAALSEADNLCAELDTLRESQTCVQELEVETAELERSKGAWKAMATVVAQSRDEYGAMVDQLIVERNALAAERDDLAERLDSLDNAHQITLAALAEARRGNTEPWHGKAAGAL